MAAWTYVGNSDPSQRYTIFQFLLDDSTIGTIKLGSSYELSDAEVGRISQFVVLVPAGSGGDPGGGGGPAPSGQGVNFYATDADLPGSASGHPVVLVLTDAEADGQATLRYWSGVAWRIIGLAGGGSISSDFIIVAANLAGITGGKTLIWNDGQDQFTPGSPS